MAAPRYFDPATTWAALANVTTALAPLLVSALVVAVAIYFVFVILVPRAVRIGIAPAPVVPAQPPNAIPPPAPPPTVTPDELGLGAMSGISYLLVASIFGVIVGMLTNQIGGLEALLTEPTADSFLKGLASVVVLALGVIGGLFLDNSGVQQRRPLGALAFLVCFLVSGLYWPMITS
jgi:hypothetical protein